MKTKRNMIALGIGIVGTVAGVAFYNHVHASSVTVASTPPTTLLAGVLNINMDVVDHKDDTSKMSASDDDEGG